MNDNKFLIELTNMIVDLKILENELDEADWKDEDKIYEYNEQIENILIFLKERL
jgi:hypothetical protein